tara:strand:+ start:2430 stop:3125 length:696 start_codon:yes stop_codon:yes gene_type:complete
MSVDPPDSGDVVTRGGVESMHNTVASVVNNVNATTMGGATLGSTQLPSLIHTADFLDNTTAEVFDYSDPFDEADQTSTGGWAELTSYILDNGGSGYVLPYDGFIYAYCSLRVSDWDSVVTGEFSYAGEEQVWANLFYKHNGVADKQVRNNRFINLRPPLTPAAGPSFGVDREDIEETISIAWIEKVEAGTLNKISIVAAASEGGASKISSGFDDVTIKHGTIGFFYIPLAV